MNQTCIRQQKKLLNVTEEFTRTQRNKNSFMGYVPHNFAIKIENLHTYTAKMKIQRKVSVAYYLSEIFSKTRRNEPRILAWAL